MKGTTPFYKYLIKLNNSTELLGKLTVTQLLFSTLTSVTKAEVCKHMSSY